MVFCVEDVCFEEHLLFDAVADPCCRALMEIILVISIQFGAAGLKRTMKAVLIAV